MPFDDIPDDEPSSGAPLPPEDRLWRHPSEVARAARERNEARRQLAQTADLSPRGRLLLLTGAGGAVAGAAFTLVIVALFGLLSARVVERPVIQRVPLSGPVTEPVSFGSADAVPVITQRTAPAIARVRATTAEGFEIGSGVAIREDGYLATSADLVRDREQVVVQLSTGEQRRARVVGYDQYTNIGVIHIPGQQLRVPDTADTDELVLGEQIVVLGAVRSGATGPTVSSGVVSATGRRVERPGLPALVGLIQTDANLAPGVLGGALLDDAGEVVGVLSTFDVDATGTESIGLATPIAMVRSVADGLIDNGHPGRSWLGITGVDLDADRAATLGLSGGAEITTVLDQSPAEVAGLVAGDVITSARGTTIDSMSMLVVDLREARPGQIVELTFVRGDKHHTTLVILGEPRRQLT